MLRGRHETLTSCVADKSKEPFFKVKKILEKKEILNFLIINF